MHQPATPLTEQDAVTSPDDRIEQHKLVRKLVSIAIVAGAVLITLYVWSTIERHPRTDDAAARANVVGIVPRVRGQIVKLAVQDNQLVKEGDLLFEIDPDDYELALEKAKSALAALDEQIEIGRSQDEELKFGVKAAEAGVAARESASRNRPTTRCTGSSRFCRKVSRQPNKSIKPRTSSSVAAQALAAEEQKLNQAKTALSTLQTLLAQRPGAVAAVKQAELDLSYCKVTAPFDGRVINLNISGGAYASIGVPVFSLLDTTKWYVIANFREAEVRHMAPGSEAIVYLSSAPNQRFRGKVQGIGWAVKPEGEIDLPPSGVPYVKRELNWVRVAQRFPVRIEVENPDRRSFPHGRVRGCDHQRSAAEIIYERDVCRSATDRFRLAWLAQTRARADERARNQNSHHSRGRRFVRHHFDGASSAGAVCLRLYGFLRLQGEQAPHDTYRTPRIYWRDHRHWRNSPALQVYLWSSRTAHSRNGDRTVSWNVCVTHFCARATRIPHRFCCRCLAVGRRRDSLT